MKGNQILFRLITILVMTLSMTAVGASNVWSADLHSAKAAGSIGEQPNGYLGISGRAGSDVMALVRNINQKRKAAYQKIASKNGTSLRAVEQMAGKKAIRKTAPGQFIRSPSGQWIRK